ncbi:MAG: UvrB/UvrC motif-containing protein [Verrucomicrobiales bacterium]|nr:UvrB/UvrC motif-containing protein [Verrucomicrobiales bacterium]
MTCDCCDKPAKVFLTQIVGDKMQKVNLCDECSKAQGVTDPTGFALADVLGEVGSEKKLDRARPGEISCPSCGFTQTDFKKTGRLGCAACYDIFREPLRAVLPNMHRGTAHTGKVPSTFVPPTPDPEELLADLKNRLDLAVTDEKYEEAAQLRDEIRKISTI